MVMVTWAAAVGTLLLLLSRVVEVFKISRVILVMGTWQGWGAGVGAGRNLGLVKWHLITPLIRSKTATSNDATCTYVIWRRESPSKHCRLIAAGYHTA
jgi:hypothetical protein